MVTSTDQPGLHHVAFTFGSMREFLDRGGGPGLDALARLRPDDLVKRFRAGVPIAELVARD